VVVVNMVFMPRFIQDFCKPSDPRLVLTVNQDQAGYQGEIKVFEAGKIQDITGGFQEEVAHALLLRSGEYHCRMGIKLAGGDHRAEAVEVGIYVGCNDIHVQEMRLFRNICVSLLDFLCGVALLRLRVIPRQP